MSVKPLVTAEQFWEMPDPPDRPIELFYGQVVDKPALGVRAGLAKLQLLCTLGTFMEHHDLGLVLPGVGCVLRRDPDTVRHVGISFIARGRVPAGEPLVRGKGHRCLHR